MGIGQFFKSQLSQIIEWKDQQPDRLLYKFPSGNDELKNSSKLIIGPGQGVLLVYEGKVTDHIATEGIYNLETDNHPFITTLLSLRSNFESEHKLRIFFYRTSENVNRSWGTPQPVKYVDPVYKIPVELGANGTFSFRISDPPHLFSEVIGSKDSYTVEEASALLQSRFPQGLVSVLAQSSVSCQLIDSRLAVLSGSIREQLNPELGRLGFELTDFKLNGTIFDAETRRRIGGISDITSETMAAREGGLTYAELEKLRALRDAARNEGGLAGAGLQMGVGMDLGKNLYAAGATSSPDAETPLAKLKQLKMLLDEGIINQEEFDSRKKAWLDKL